MPARRTAKKPSSTRTTRSAEATSPDLDRLPLKPAMPPLPAHAAPALPTDAALMLPLESAPALPLESAPALSGDAPASAPRPAAPKAGPPAAHGRSATTRGSQRAAQPRRYAFRRS
ncbi:hypothetical protein [Micromonospora sp. URMC 103]|uniref:hypothetical protein n=1 Tax=Micromonospora sp. URMC 103 TaxID=3423406 RepID=UPI003F1B4617